VKEELQHRITKVVSQKTKTFSFRAEKCCFPYCYYCVILVLLVLFRVSNSQWFGFWVF
jgi:hypothetical protein